MLLLALAGAGLALSFDFSARGQPGAVETYLATRAKRFYVGRGAQGLQPPPFTDLRRTQGFSLFSGSCASCHGFTGREPSKIGLNLYPPTPALDAPQVQQYSDSELFWVVKNGIRLTGMPSFAAIHSDDEIWSLVSYVRSLREKKE